MDDVVSWIVFTDERAGSPWPWLHPLPRHCNSRRIEGCLGLTMTNRWQAGSNDLSKAGSRKMEGGVEESFR